MRSDSSDSKYHSARRSNKRKDVRGRLLNRRADPYNDAPRQARSIFSWQRSIFIRRWELPVTPLPRRFAKRTRSSRKYHPDVRPGDKDAADQFKKVQAAYSVLGDAEKRVQYDRYGHAFNGGQRDLIERHGPAAPMERTPSI